MNNKWFNNHVSEIHKTSLNSAFIPTENVTVKEVDNLRCTNVLSIDTNNFSRRNTKSTPERKIPESFEAMRTQIMKSISTQIEVFECS